MIALEIFNNINVFIGYSKCSFGELSKERCCNFQMQPIKNLTYK